MLTPNTCSPFLAIDPGTKRTAAILFSPDGCYIRDQTLGDPESVLALCRPLEYRAVVIERVGHYGTGMPAGESVFDTAELAGRFAQALGYERSIPVYRVKRQTVKAHLCGSARAKDSNIRQALIDLWGGNEKAIGNAAAPGPLYSIKADLWQALGLAVTWADLERTEGK